MRRPVTVVLVVLAAAAAVAGCSSSAHASPSNFCATAHQIQAENAAPLNLSSMAQQRARYLDQWTRLRAAALGAHVGRWPASDRLAPSERAKVQTALATCGLSVDIFGTSVRPTNTN